MVVVVVVHVVVVVGSGQVVVGSGHFVVGGNFPYLFKFLSLGSSSL